MKSQPYSAIILAGGLGTRLRSVVSNLPKSMASIRGKPFLHFIFQYLAQQQVREVILSVGYKQESIRKYFGGKYLGVTIKYSVEDEPLGTGGAIKRAFQEVKEYAYVLHGDTFFDIELNSLSNFYFDTDSDIALSLKQLKNFDRYGAVLSDSSGRIHEFAEKKFTEDGLINGGVYFLNRKITEAVKQEKFSFEKEVLEKLAGSKKLYGKVYQNYFIDIGIPEDYLKAGEDFKSLFP